MTFYIFHRQTVCLVDPVDFICSLFSWWEGFGSFSLDTLWLGFNCGFASTPTCGLLTGVCSWGSPGGHGFAPVRMRCGGSAAAWVEGFHNSYENTEDPEEPKQSWEKWMELGESTFLTSDYTAKLQSLRDYGTDTKQKYRPMKQDRKPRNKPMHLWVPYIWQRRPEYIMGQKLPFQ